MISLWFWFDTFYIIFIFLFDFFKNSVCFLESIEKCERWHCNFSLNTFYSNEDSHLEYDTNSVSFITLLIICLRRMPFEIRFFFMQFFIILFRSKMCTVLFFVWTRNSKKKNTEFIQQQAEHLLVYLCNAMMSLQWNGNRDANEWAAFCWLNQKVGSLHARVQYRGTSDN